MNTIVVLWSRNISKHINTDNAQKFHHVSNIMSWVNNTIIPYVVQNAPHLKWNDAFNAIIVLPEYYFSRTRQHSYQRKAMGEEAKDIVLQQLLQYSRYFPKILLLPGTIAFKKSLVRPPNKTIQQSTRQRKSQSRLQKASSYLLSSPDDTKITSNYPFGSPYSPASSTLTPREKLQRLDQLGENAYIYKNQACVIQNGQILFKYNKRKDYFETYGSSNEIHAPDVNRSASKTIHGIDFGLEICFDHAQRSLVEDITYENRMAQHLAAHGYAPQPTMTSTPQIHIVVSDWASNSASPVREGGFFIHASSNNTQTCVKLKKHGTLVDHEPGRLAKIAECWVDGDPLHAYLIDI
ncbi:MAG: hypothetical protein RIG63_20520 [Coleofasciculus chthonoplastes F3-SA18-01]|uniref:hypothetical protein n=1 Tax=Coleofasciculus chthonoplastes TaxID=64178 RepID=UPI0033051490